MKLKICTLIATIAIFLATSAQAEPDAYLHCYNHSASVALSLTDTVPGSASAQYFVSETISSGRTHHNAPVILPGRPAGKTFGVSVSQQGDSVIYESNGFKFVLDTKGFGQAPVYYSGRIYKGAFNHDVEVSPFFECRFVKIERYPPNTPRTDPRCNYHCHV